MHICNEIQHLPNILPHAFHCCCSTLEHKRNKFKYEVLNMFMFLSLFLVHQNTIRLSQILYFTFQLD